MNSEQINSIIRHALTLLGAFLVGGGIKFFGQVVDTAYWQEITGVILAGYAMYLSIKSKEVNIEKWQGFARQIITFIGGILVSRGVLNDQALAAILAFVVAILPLLQSTLARQKSDQLKAGVIHPMQLKGTGKVIKALAMLLLFAGTASAQGFFRSVPKPIPVNSISNKGKSLQAIEEAAATIKNEFRPVTNLASYIIGNNVKEASIITGAGVGYERLIYNATTEKWKIVWSINALMYGRIALGDSSNGKKFMYGLSIGAFDNVLMVGGATDGVNGYGTIGVGIPLNNL